VPLLGRKETEAERLEREERRKKAGMAYQRGTSAIGLVGIGTALGAILGAADVSHWVTGLIVSLVCVGLAAFLWTVKL
jgi:hypothetical protein